MAPTRAVLMLLLSLAIACGASQQLPPPPGEGGNLKEDSTAKTVGIPSHNAAATPRKARPPAGWSAVDTAERTRIDRFAADYMAFLGRARTSRRTVDQLVALFQGALPISDSQRPTAGARRWLPGPGGKAAAFVLVGNRPIEEGARIIIASVDAPRIDLKQRPVYTKVGFAMLDTFLYGSVKLASWLTHPLALFVHAARPGAAAGPARISLGDKPNDPVFVIPDLLPHLSRKIQRATIVDSPERLDAIAATSQKKLFEFLRSRGVDQRVFSSAEASLVPAARPRFIGVDRALIAGYGHSHRAMAYAALRALTSAKTSHLTAIVIAIDGREVRYTGSSGTAFIEVALNTIFDRLASGGTAVDMLTTRRIHARSAALMASSGAGKTNAGVVLNPRADDALPLATRRVLDSFEASGAHHQIASKRRSAPARGLGTLDIDAIGVGLPIRGHGTPAELLSTLDLYQARKAFAGWLLRK